MSNLSNLSWKLPTSLLLLSLVPVATGVVRLSGLTGGRAVTPENARVMTSPEPFVLYIVCTTLFCVLEAFQLDSALRQLFPRLHRSAGRVAAPCGTFAALIDDIGCQRADFLFPRCSHGLGLGTEHGLRRMANSPPFAIRLNSPRKTL